MINVKTTEAGAKIFSCKQPAICGLDKLIALIKQTINNKQI